jgi:hypothetical protein
MAWTLGGHRIYTQKSSENTSQILPRLQPLSGGTVIQSFGFDSIVRSITVIVVGDTIKNALLAFAQDGGTSHAFVSPEGSLGSWIVKSCVPNRTNSTCQSIDISQPEEAPVYEIELELWKEG